MNSTNRNLKISLACASLMLVVGAAVQLFSIQTQRQQTALMDALEQSSEYVITNTGETQACASVFSGQVLWDCKGSSCTRQEAMECLQTTETLSAFAQEDEVQGDVAGVYDVVNPEQCRRPGVGYTGQSGCWSKRKISVVGSPRFYTLDPAGNALDAGQFTKAAHNDLADKWRQYDVSKGEIVKWAIALKNNSSAPVSDTYMFSIGKVIEAPKGVPADSKTPLCEAQLNELNKFGNMVQVPRTIFSGKPYSLAAGQQKLVHAEWKPTKADCGLYQIDLGASDFQGSAGKTACSNPTADSVIAAAFVRVVGCEDTSLSCSSATFRNENGTAPITSAKPNELVSIKITLTKSPAEIGATAPVYVLPQFGPNLTYVNYIIPVEDSHRCVKLSDSVQCSFDASSKDKEMTLIARVGSKVVAGNTINLPIKVTYKGVDVTKAATSAKSNCSPTLTVGDIQKQTISCTKTFYNPVRQADGTYRVPATMKITATGGIPANLNIKDFALMIGASPTSFSGSLKSLLPQIANFPCKDLGLTFPGSLNNQIGFACNLSPLAFSNSVATYNYGFVATKGSNIKETLTNVVQVFSGDTKLTECLATVAIPAKPVAQSCTYVYSDWVDQYRTDHIKPIDKNSPKSLSTITIPQGSAAEKVKIIYEYRPLRDKTSANTSGIAEFSREANPGRCAPQANEEVLMYLATENALSRQVTAVHRFNDNKIADALVDPSAKGTKTFEFSLNPGVYSLNARWAGDGTIYCTRDASINPAACKTNGQNILGEFVKDLTYKYKSDLTNPSSPVITYDTAVKEAPKYGPLCKWNGSYQVRTGWCIVGQNTVSPAAQLQTIELNLTNTRVFGSTDIEIYVNGAKQTINGSSRIVVPARGSKLVKFNYLNAYPQKTVLEIKSLTAGGTKITRLNVTVQGKSIYTSVLAKDITREGVKYEYGTSSAPKAN